MHPLDHPDSKKVHVIRLCKVNVARVATGPSDAQNCPFDSTDKSSRIAEQSTILCDSISKFVIKVLLLQLLLNIDYLFPIYKV